jgi:hypothetical protein
MHVSVRQGVSGLASPAPRASTNGGGLLSRFLEQRMQNVVVTTPGCFNQGANMRQSTVRQTILGEYRVAFIDYKRQQFRDTLAR